MDTLRMTITVFQCMGLEEFMVAEARAQADYAYHHPEVLDGDDDCKHCGEPLGLDDDGYKQECGYCGRSIYE